MFQFQKNPCHTCGFPRLSMLISYEVLKVMMSFCFLLCIPPLLSVENLQTLASSTVWARLEFVQQPQAVSVSALLAPTERSRHSWTQSQHCTGQRSARRPQRDSFVLSQRTDWLIYNLAACSLLDLPWESRAEVNIVLKSYPRQPSCYDCRWNLWHQVSRDSLRHGPWRGFSSCITTL